jgi:transcriptional regulator of NAD metabolism
MMMVKVEAREFRLKQIIEKLEPTITKHQLGDSDREARDEIRQDGSF